MRGLSALCGMQGKSAQRGLPVVAFQGVYGAYSEAAALEALPNCQPLPCEHFETAFQVLLPCPDHFLLALFLLSAACPSRVCVRCRNVHI